jgi:hypothetical protein
MLNADKTQIIIFKTKSMPKTIFNININGNNIRTSDECTFLGIILDTQLNWASQVNSLIARLNKVFFIFKRLKTCCSIDVLLNVYNAYVYSILNYNIIIWGQAIEISRIFILQKRILRTIFNLPFRETVRPYFSKYKILTVHAIFIYNNIIFLKQNLKKYEFTHNVHCRNTRNRDNIYLTRHNYARYEKCPHYTSSRMYNALPDSIKNITPFNKFKKKLKEYLCDNPLYNINDFLNR